MTFIYGKWKAIEETKRLREKYGENSHIMERDGLNENGECKNRDPQPKHSFSHLLNKKFIVPHREPDPRFSEKTVITYRITDREKARNQTRFRLMRNGEL